MEYKAMTVEKTKVIYRKRGELKERQKTFKGKVGLKDITDVLGDVAIISVVQNLGKIVIR